MSGLLLDSNVFLWWSASPSILPEPVIESIAQAEQAFVSIVTPWELELKHALAKLRLPTGLWDRVDKDGFELVGIDLSDAIAAARLPQHHRDPFDRMIIAQALRRGLTIVTRDRSFAAYGVPVLTA